MPTQIAARGKKILRISESHPKKNQPYQCKGFFLEFYLEIDIAMENNSERTQKIVITCQVGRIQIFTSQHYQTNQTKTSKTLILTIVKIQIRLHKSSTKLFFQRDLVQSV